jgi:hypothetical protein
MWFVLYSVCTPVAVFFKCNKISGFIQASNSVLVRATVSYGSFFVGYSVTLSFVCSIVSFKAKYFLVGQ